MTQWGERFDSRNQLNCLASTLTKYYRSYTCGSLLGDTTGHRDQTEYFAVISEINVPETFKV